MQTIMGNFIQAINKEEIDATPGDSNLINETFQDVLPQAECVDQITEEIQKYELLKIPLSEDINILQ